MAKISLYPDGGAKQDTDEFVVARAGANVKLQGSQVGAGDASGITYTPSNLPDWNGGVDPGNADDAFDQLASRMTTEEAKVTDAGDVTYTPAVAGDWDNGADPGNLDDALDQLARRMFDQAPRGYLLNGYLAVSVAASDLTVAVKTLAGANPSAGEPVYIRIGDTIHPITAALSVTANDGTNWFNAGSSELATQTIGYFTYLGYNAANNVVTMAFARFPSALTYGGFSTTSTDEDYGKFSYTTGAASSDEVENVGYFHAVLSAGAGYTWSLPGTTVTISRPKFVSEWLEWTPQYSCSGAMTYTSVSTSIAKYQINYSTNHIVLAATGTTGGVASNTIRASLPFDGQEAANYPAAAGYTDDGAGAITGLSFLTPGAPDTVSVKKYDATNYGLSGGDKIYPDITYQMELP